MEYSTEAFVLRRADSGEFDGLAVLYTKNYGKIVARAKSIRKITSKLNGHLQPLNFVFARLVEKKNLQIIDALSFAGAKETKNNASIASKLLRISALIEEMTFEFHPDGYLWNFIKEIAKKDFDEPSANRLLLKILGFAPDSADCHICHSGEIDYFYKADQIFFCRKCGGKISKDEVVSV